MLLLRLRVLRLLLLLLLLFLNDLPMLSARARFFTLFFGPRRSILKLKFPLGRKRSPPHILGILFLRPALFSFSRTRRVVLVLSSDLLNILYSYNIKFKH
jgi:hypothetical protein